MSTFTGPTLYGILDTSEPGRRLWIGSEAGPLTYQDIALASAAATVLNARCKSTDRFVARIMRADEFHVCDEITPERTAREAIVELEGFDDGSWDSDVQPTENDVQALREKHGVRVLPLRRRGAA